MRTTADPDAPTGAPIVYGLAAAVFWSVLAIFYLAGCQTAPQEVRDVEAAQDTSVQRILRADEIAIDALAMGYRTMGKREAASNLEADLADPDNQEEVTVVVPATEEGQEDRTETRHIVTPGTATMLAMDALAYVERVNAEVDGLLAAWRQARDGNEANYMRLRDWLRERWYNRPGFGPDEIRALGEGTRDAMGGTD